jgi:hypothetical protein
MSKEQVLRYKITEEQIAALEPKFTNSIEIWEKLFPKSKTLSGLIDQELTLELLYEFSDTERTEILKEADVSTSVVATLRKIFNVWRPGMKVAKELWILADSDPKTVSVGSAKINLNTTKIRNKFESKYPRYTGDFFNYFKELDGFMRKEDVKPEETLLVILKSLPEDNLDLVKRDAFENRNWNINIATEIYKILEPYANKNVLLDEVSKLKAIDFNGSVSKYNHKFAFYAALSGKPKEILIDYYRCSLPKQTQTWEKN